MKKFILLFVLAGCSHDEYIKEPVSKTNKIKELRYYYDARRGIDVPIYVERDLTINEMFKK